MTTIRIEDDDGFVSEFLWPDDTLMLANTEFIEVFERAHDARKKAMRP